MENKKGSGIFLGVIGVATLLVAIIGATFAYFSASAGSTEDFQTSSTALKLGFENDITGLNTDLIPAKQRYALYAGTNQDWINDEEGPGQCHDDNDNEICSIYKFTIGNPNFTTAQDMYGKIVITTNEFSNLWFAIYDEQNNQAVAPTPFNTAQNNEIALTDLNQRLLPSSEDRGADGNPIASFDEALPSTYTLVTDTITYNGEEVTAYNKRTYTLVMWIEESNSDQTEADSGKVFAAGIQFTSAGGGSGVTGIIAAADAGA